MPIAQGTTSSKCDAISPRNTSTMLRRLFRLIAWTSVLAIAGATLLGLLAAWLPPFELFNHFRPFWVAGALLLFLAALLARSRYLIVTAATVAILNGALFAFALSGGAQSADRTDTAFLRVVAFNIHWHNGQIEKIAQSLKTSGADVLVLSEVSEVNSDALHSLHETYPYQTQSLDIVIYSKHPILKTGSIGWTFYPPYSGIARWVRLDVKGKPVEVVGVHLAFPLFPAKQVDDMQMLTAFVKERTLPLIVAGDFNLTPWSMKLQRFNRETGLRRTNTFMMTWPARTLPAFVAIDNIYVSPEFSVIGIEKGPDLGADHLPLIADLALVE